MRNCTQPRRRAFSLAELVCVLIIISALSAIAAPRLSGSLAHRRVQAAAERVVADLALARHHARQTSQVQEVVFKPGNETYELPGMPDPDRPGSPYKVSLAADPYGANLKSVVMGTDKTVRFDHFGMTDLTTNGSLRLKVGNYVRDVVLDANTGVAEVQE